MRTKRTVVVAVLSMSCAPRPPTTAEPPSTLRPAPAPGSCAGPSPITGAPAGSGVSASLARRSKQLVTFDHTRGVHQARLSPDGTRIVTASYDRTAKLWDARTGRLVVTVSGRLSSAGTVEFSPDGKRFITANEDTANVWDSTTGKLVFTLRGHAAEISTPTFSSDGLLIATASYDQTAKLWDARNGNLLGSMRHPGVYRVVFSPNAKCLLTASNDLRVWEVRTHQPVAGFTALTGHKTPPVAMMFSPDGTRIVTASDDHTAKLWDARSGALEASLEHHHDTVSDARFSPDGSRIVTSSYDGTARVWDLRGALLLTLTTSGALWSASFSHDGEAIATAGPMIAEVWNARSGMRIATLAGHTHRVYQAEFSPDDAQIVTASEDQTARLWGLMPGTDTAAFPGQLPPSPQRTEHACSSGDSSHAGRAGPASPRDRSTASIPYRTPPALTVNDRAELIVGSHRRARHDVDLALGAHRGGFDHQIGMRRGDADHRDLAGDQLAGERGCRCDRGQRRARAA
jgi:WD40 repeat protein